MTNLRALLFLPLLSCACTPLLVPVSPQNVTPPAGVELGWISQDGDRLTLKVVNALAEPVIVQLNKAVLETPNGSRAARASSRPMMLPPGDTTVIDLEFDLRGLREGEFVSVVLEAVVRRERNVVVAPLKLLVKCRR